MEFVNLTPQVTDILDPDGNHLRTVHPSGTIGLAAGDPPTLLNVPPPCDGTVYIVLPALTEASDREDLLSVIPEQAQRSRRGNLQSHVCCWNGA